MNGAALPGATPPARRPSLGFACASCPHGPRGPLARGVRRRPPVHVETPAVWTIVATAPHPADAARLAARLDASLALRAAGRPLEGLALYRHLFGPPALDAAAVRRHRARLAKTTTR